MLALIGLNIAAMIYPEFQYRPPPPSYQASMQEYRLRLLLLDRGGGGVQPGLSLAPPPIGPNAAAAVSPPPTYRSQVGNMLRAPMLFRRDAHANNAAPGESSTCSSRPPSYRSRAGSTRPASVAATGVEPGLRAESRRASLLMLAGCSSSPGTPPPSRHSNTPQPVCDVSVICVGGDSPKIAPPPPASTTGSEKASLVEESNGARLVTIVQTGDVSPSSDSGVTTVTVSGLLASSSSCNDTVPQLVFTQTATEGEMEILAHL
ncbi:hypothetical protein B566_EDAN011366 [Ephemera danica]|nr:hypothetical protein B566_EDAN011366 [Ephemera danica]